MVLPPLASLSDDVAPILALMIPIVALCIPMVAMMIKHQQRMAEILNGSSQNGEIEGLRREVADLRSIVHQQAFTLDRLSQPILSAEAERVKTL